ncbi:MAG TPA: glycosyltransferase family 25 protein [Pyrinomonadaceae bacterium]|nr:glycosyltransferase family 25 protein [Pyrinomonadaceae bacterium]
MLSKSFRDFHDRAFVVTVRSFIDRQESSLKELGDGNFEFIYGVDKATVSKEQMITDGTYDEVRAIEIDRSSKPMTLGHICCSLGHANVYRHMVESGTERAMIFEDDVVVLPANEADISAAVEHVPADAELIYWGWTGIEKRPAFASAKQQLYKLQHSLGLLKYNHRMIDNLYPREHNKYFKVAGKHFCAHAYTLTLSGAKTLLRWNTPIVLNADNALMYAVMNGDLRAYVSTQQFFGQRSLDESDPIQSLTQS